jgi:hypothetical protein
LRKRGVRVVACLAVAAVVAAGCGSKSDADASIGDTFREGTRAMRTERGTALERKLEATLKTLRRDQASTPDGRRGRRLAIEGFKWALVSIRAELEFQFEDSGRLAEATKDARRADTARRKSERLLHAAGRVLGVEVGRLDLL